MGGEPGASGKSACPPLRFVVTGVSGASGATGQRVRHLWGIHPAALLGSLSFDREGPPLTLRQMQSGPRLLRRQSEPHGCRDGVSEGGAGFVVIAQSNPKC